MKVSNQVITIQPPIGGVSRRVGYQNQPPYTCYDCVNMWPTEYGGGRTLLSTRPRQETESVPAGFDAINMLADINGVVSGQPTRSMVMAKGGDIYWWDGPGTGWVAATGAAASSVTTLQAQVSAKAFLQKLYIENPGAKPIVFDYATGIATVMVESAGTVPNGLEGLVVWQGALWGFVDNVVYGSRIGNALDWDFAAVLTDKGGAFFTAGEDEGLIRGEVQGLIPLTTDTLLVCTLEGIMAIYGHPRKGGIIEDFSDHVLISQYAWCRAPDNHVYAMTQQGIIKISPQNGVPPQLLSDQHLPTNFAYSALDNNQPFNMSYDVVHKGIHINSGILTTDEHWWYDLVGGGFFRMSFGNNRGPNVVLENPPINEGLQSPVMYGCENGSLYTLTSAGTETFTAEVYIGPIALANNLLQQGKIQQGMVTFNEVEPTMAGQMDISVGPSAIDALTRAVDDQPQYVIDLAELSAGSRVFFPKLTGNSMVIHVSQTSGVFSLDQMAMSVIPAGTNRMHRYLPKDGLPPPTVQI